MSIKSAKLPGYVSIIKLLNQSQGLMIFTLPDNKKDKNLPNNRQKIVIDLGTRLGNITKGSNLIIYDRIPKVLPNLILGAKYSNHYLPNPKVVKNFIKFCELEGVDLNKGHCSGRVLIQCIDNIIKKWQH